MLCKVHAIKKAQSFSNHDTRQCHLAMYMPDASFRAYAVLPHSTTHHVTLHNLFSGAPDLKMMKSDSWHRTGGNKI